jgi:signal transduction histidine kinase
MQKGGEQIIIGIVAGSIVLLMLGLFIFLFILYYQKKHNSYLTEKVILNKQFEETLNQTQLEVQEQTRQKLAIDLHDNIGQLLSLTNITLASVNLIQHERAQQKLNDAQALISRSIQELRRLSKVLHGEQLIKQGLVESIKLEVDWLVNKGYYKVNFEDLSNGKDFAKENLNLLIFRTFQESLNNILKHADADAIVVRLEYIIKELYVTISDNGSGFNTDFNTAILNGMGLANMKKRAEMMGGTMCLQSEKGTGTTLIFKFPYE